MLLDSILDKIRPQLLSKLAPLTLTLLGTVATAMLQRWFPSGQVEVSNKILLQILTWLFVVFGSMASWLASYWLQSRIRTRYAVCWDARGNPICPADHKPLHIETGSTFRCSCCGKDWPIFERCKGDIMIWDAMDKMKQATK